MFFSNVLPPYAEAFLRLLYPSRCALCETPLELEEQGVCVSCGLRLQRFKLPPSEERIRIPFSWGDEGWALFRYEDSVKEIFHQIKFERRRDLLALFAEEIRLFLKRRPTLHAYDWVIPIPLDSRRRLEREFNQSGLLAREVRRDLEKKDGTFFLKKRMTSPQSFLGRQERRLNVERAFRVVHPSRLFGQSVLLIDDIFTTGSTLEEAAKTLKETGARRVGYLVLARTPAS